MNRAVLSLALALFLTIGAGAQEPVTSYVEADGEATIFAVPTQAEFLVVFKPVALKVPPAEAAEGQPAVAPAPEPAPALPERTADKAQTNATATDEVNTAVKAFRKTLLELDLHPVEFEVSVPTTRDAANANASSTARMRFSLTGFANPDTGPGQFSDLCDKLANLAKSVGADLIGPSFDIEDKESVLRNAVTQATTNAYPIGDAIALSLSARVDSVDSVKVVDITWNKPFHTIPIEPNLRQISCTAKVHVTYSVRSAQP